MAGPVLKRSPTILLLLAAGLGATTCAPTDLQQDVRYPRRPPGCDLAVYHTAVPGAAAWDDLGIAEIGCHVSYPLSQCLQMLKAEGCRMGGDMIYNVPRAPLRPQDQVMIFRGQVAHTRGGPIKKEEDADLPPPATADEAAQPVVPLTGPAAPKAP
jgi:hypothetical protein